MKFKIGFYYVGYHAINWYSCLAQDTLYFFAQGENNFIASRYHGYNAANFNELMKQHGEYIGV